MILKNVIKYFHIIAYNSNYIDISYMRGWKHVSYRIKLPPSSI